MLHYKACARTRRQKAADIALMVFGLVAAAYTSVMTIKVGATVRRHLTNLTNSSQLMLDPQPAVPPSVGLCDDAPAGGFNLW